MTQVDPRAAGRREVRSRIVEAAARLLHEHGPAAVTTRAVAQAAATQAPTIYRLFGDKDGLLEAVAEHALATHVATKAAAVESAGAQGVDPVADLRDGWATQVAFGLGNPALFHLLGDPGRAATSPASAAGLEVLRARVRRVAAAGRLRVGEERAVEVLGATGTGVVSTLLARAPDDRDPDLVDAMWGVAAREVLTEAGPVAAGDGAAVTAVALRAVVGELPALTDAERSLMAEWLDRSISTAQERGAPAPQAPQAPRTGGPTP